MQGMTACIATGGALLDVENKIIHFNISEKRKLALSTVFRLVNILYL